MRKGEFILTPMVAAGLFGAAPHVWWFLAGATLWTFIEYAVHRALHVFRVRQHHHHHARPAEEPDAIFWPFWICLLALLLVPGLPLSLLGGLASGYAWFIAIHKACHHTRSDVIPTLLEHHDKHHHAHPNANFGVSTRLWDVIFRTAA